MSPHGTPALLSAVLTATLALIAWLHRRHDRLNVALAIFAASLALLSLGNLVFTQSTTLSQASLRYHIPLSIFPLAIGSASYYVLVLTGRNQRLRERALGVPLWLYLVAGGIYLVLLSGLMQGTTLLFSEIRQSPAGGFYLQHTEQIGLFMVGLPIIVGLLIALYVRALRAAEPGPYKKHLWITAFGLMFMFVSVPVIGIATKPYMPGGSHLVFIGPAISCLILYFAVVSYQFDRIQQLNHGLERKVEDRTRHLLEAQAKLVQSEKMASLGRLVAGVAHELNNPIGAVCSTSNTARRWCDKLEAMVEEELPETSTTGKQFRRAIGSMRDSHKVIEEGSERVATIVQRLKSFAGLDQAELRLASIHESIEDAIGMLPAGWSQTVSLKRDFEEGLPEIRCYPAKLNHALQGVLANAVEAIDGEGRIHIRTRADGEEVTIAIQDNGCGVPAELLDRIFDPGFTTKSRGVGTGLGLAVVYQVMAEHQGRVDVTSDEAEGTTFTLRLPIQ